jgi:hypothetical protein
VTCTFPGFFLGFLKFLILCSVMSHCFICSFFYLLRLGRLRGVPCVHFAWGFSLNCTQCVFLRYVFTPPPPPETNSVWKHDPKLGQRWRTVFVTDGGFTACHSVIVRFELSQGLNVGVLNATSFFRQILFLVYWLKMYLHVNVYRLCSLLCHGHFQSFLPLRWC